VVMEMTANHRTGECTWVKITCTHSVFLVATRAWLVRSSRTPNTAACQSPWTASRI